MNLPNKLTITRIIITFIIILILLLPFDSFGINLPQLFINETIVIDIKYLIAGGLFLIASITDFVDGYIARKYNQVTDFGKMNDAIADKILVNSILIILSSTGFIHPIIPIVIIIRDSFVNALKMVAGSHGEVVSAIWMGKIKTATLMIGITLTLFYNLPFELWNLRISDFLLLIAVLLSVISAFQYYNNTKKYINFKEEKVELEEKDEQKL